MRKFKPGQQVVCTHPTGMWLGVFPGPKYGEIVTIDRYSEIYKTSLELREYNYSNVGNELPDCYNQCWFEPLADIEELVNKISEKNVV